MVLAVRVYVGIERIKIVERGVRGVLRFEGMWEVEYENIECVEDG
ncbi:hypothetical protein [Bacillus pumilus]|nr:hypothetical protein [Bacillus pumilus]